MSAFVAQVLTPYGHCIEEHRSKTNGERWRAKDRIQTTLEHEYTLMGKGVRIGKGQRGIRKIDLSSAFLFRPPFFARLDWVQSALEHRARTGLEIDRSLGFAESGSNEFYKIGNSVTVSANL